MPFMRNKRTGEMVEVDANGMPVAGAPSAPQADPFVVRPDPGRIQQQNRENARQDQSAGNDAVRTGIAQRGEQRDISNKAFDHANTLRDEYNNLPEVKAYRNAIGIYNSALKTADTPQGDLALIYGYAKLMDPGSVVREGEANSVSNADTLAGQITARLSKELSGTGTFSPEARANLRKEMQTRIAAYNDAYNLTRQRGTSDAEAYGIDPVRVIGPHYGEPYLKDIEEYWKRQNEQPKPAAGPASGSAGAPSQGYDPVNGLFGTVTDEGRAPNSGLFGGDYSPEALTRGIGQGLGTVVEGVSSLPAIAIDPWYKPLVESMGYQTGGISRDFRRSLGLPDNPNPISSAIQRGGAAALTGALGAQGMAPLLNNATAQGVANTLAAAPARQMIGGASAGASGELAREAGFGPVGQFGASVLGGMAGYGAAGLPGARPAGPVPRDFDPNVVAAGQRQGIPVRRPDAVPSLRPDMAKAEASPYGGPTVSRALQRDQNAIQTRLGQIGGEGTPQGEPYTLGQRVQGVGSRYIDRSRTKKNDLYSQAEQLSQGRRINPAQAIAEVDRNIAELTASGPQNNAATISYLQGLKSDLSKPEGFSITEFQRLRSGASKKIRGDQALTVSDATRRLGSVVNAFNADADTQLPQKATAALRQADDFYSQRQDFIGKVLQDFQGRSGDLAPERAAERFLAMTRNRANFQSLQRFYKEATPEEKADFAATIAENIGKGSNGEFGLGALATNVNKMPPNIRRLVFGDEGARALEDLKVIARAKSDTGKGLNNSRTAAVLARQIGPRILGSVTAGGAASGGNITAAAGTAAVGEIAALVAQQRSARLLLNPDFTKWLRTVPPQASDQAKAAAWQRLNAAASRSAVLANDLGPVAGQIRDVLFSPVATTKAAADEDEKRKGRQ